MNLIAQNPYRVLGVFANDPARIRTANIARIRAFAKVGKLCNFDSDYIELFGSVDRTEEALQKALTQLANPIEAKTWKLFWINSATDVNNEIDVCSTSIQSDINAAVMALNDYQTHEVAARHWALVFMRDVNEQTLFDDDRFWKSEEEKCTVAKCFLGKLVPQRDIASFQYGTTEGWFWWFRSNLSKDNCLRNVLDLKYKGFAIERLEHMIQDHDCVAPIGQNYRKLLWLARPYLRVLDTFSTYDYDNGVSSCPQDIQILKDRFAKSLVEFTNEIYSNTKYWEASQLVDMIEFIDEDVRSLACTSSTYDIIEGRLKELRAEITLLAPEECREETEQIRKLIEAFCKKKDSVRWSLSLIKQCVAPLITICDTLGKENAYYQHISTKIADNAIYSADVDLSSAEQLYRDPANDKQTATTHLQTIIRQCRILACDIELYDIEESFRNGKYATYKKRVMRIAEKYGFDDEEVAADITMTSKSDEFDACGDDYDKLCQYVQTHRDGMFYEQAIKKIYAIEDAAWPIEQTTKNLFEYKRKFPNSHNESKVIEGLDKLLLGKTNGAITDYRTLLQLYPMHPRISEIRSRIEFLIFNQCSTISGYQEYLDAYPTGKYVLQAKEKVKAIKQNEISQIFAKCKTITDYNRFILKYPTSNLCAEANLRIEDLRWEEVQRTGDIASYIKQYPNGRYIKKAVELLDRKQAQAEEAEENRKFNACKTVSDFKAYIKEYPNGRYIDIAKVVIQRRHHKLWVYTIGAVLAVLGIVVFLTSFPSHTTDKTSKAVESVESVSASAYEKDDYESSEEVYDDNLQQDEDENEYEYDDVQPLSINTADNTVYEVAPQTAKSSSTAAAIKSNIEDKWKNNRLSTGSRPYSSHYGHPLSGENEFHFKTSSGCDYVILIKRDYDGRYVDHKYVRGGDRVTITVPDGTYNVFLYTGNGWNPNKSVGACTGGFVSGESFQKDGPVTITTTIKGDYYYNQTCEYTLYPVSNGNLHLKSSNPNEAFN